MTTTMNAVVFRGKDQMAIEERPKPLPKPGEAVIKITATTICGTDVHIIKGEYPVRPGLILGHEPVGVIDQLGEGLADEYSIGHSTMPCGSRSQSPAGRSDRASFR